MNSWLVTVLLLASAANSSGGAQVPVTNYTCTQPNIAGIIDQCPVSGGFRTCAIKEGVRPALLSSNVDLGVYAWNGNANPFVVLDIPRGWCVRSVRMMFVHPSSIPALSLSVHSAERLSTNTDRTVFSLVSEAGTTPVVMNLIELARGKYLRINMTSTGRLYLQAIEVFGTNDSFCTHPSSAGGDPASPTTSVTPIRISDYSTTSGPSSTPSQSPTIQSGASFTVFVLEVTPFPSPSPTPGGVPVAPDSYVLPATISAAAVLLVVVLTAVFGVVICIITRRHNTRKSLNVQRLSSIHYQSTQSDVTFEDNQLHTGQSADVPIHDEKASVDTNHNIEVRDAPCSYAVLGPSESNDSVFQGAAEEPVAESAISRPTSQASIRSNEVSSKPILGMVAQVHPSMLDHSYASCNWENTTTGTDESGHYETSLNWQHAGGPYYNGPTYANIDPPSNSSTLAATQPPKQHSSSPKPSLSAKRPHVPPEDHIDKSSASSTSFPLPCFTHRSDGTRDYAEVDAELWGGSGNVEGDTVGEPQSITSSTTAKGAVPTQEATMGHIYAAVDYSKKKSRKGRKS